ncbi:MAG: spherulation-specific family 4 protein [Microbacterium sp.]
MPAYIPTSDTASWASLLTGDDQLGFIVVNAASGPDSSVHTDLKANIDTAHAAGTEVLGYVDTGYLGGSTPVRYTALGDSDLTSWVVQVEQDIDRWYEFYGASMDGIFLDDGMNTCGTASTTTEYVDAYVEINEYIHAHHPGALTVLNPGITVPECYDETADILVTYEGSAADFLDRPAGRETAAWQLDADPNKFWTIVHTVTDSDLQAVIDESKSENFGWVYATPDTGGNPYDIAPTGTYWDDELAATSATGTAVPSTPSRPHANDVYATGAVIGWTSSSSGNVVGYEVYRDGTRVGSVGNYWPDETVFTDVGLTPSTSYSYTVKARHRDGLLSAASTARTVTTDVSWGTAPSAPGALTSSNLSANGTTLSWTASSVTDDPVTHYDIYVDGVRKATVNASTTSIRLGYLSPGTAYTFTVRARSTSDAQSAPSNAVSVTTPTPVPIDNAAVDFGTTQTQFSADYNLSFSFHTIFIDADADASTGYATGSIGADYMIQNSSFYQQSGGSGWSWDLVSLASGPLVSVEGASYTWSVPTSYFDPSTTLTVVFSGSGGADDVFLDPITVTR